MATLTGSVQLRAGTLQGAHRRATPICRSKWTRSSRTRTYAGDSVKETFTDIGKKKFDLNNTSWRKGGMESEKVDGPVTRLWKFFFPGPTTVMWTDTDFQFPWGPLTMLVLPSPFVTAVVLFKALVMFERHSLLYGLLLYWQVQYAYCDVCSLVHATQVFCGTTNCDKLLRMQRTEEQRQETRENAARNLTNIDQDERNRRKVFGIILLVNLLTFS